MLIKKKYVVIPLLAFCLTATLFIAVATSGKKENPWDVISELQSKVEALNASNLDLQNRVEMLEGQLPQQGFLTAPAYDSGWVSVKDKYFQLNAFEHGLGTTDVLVYAYRNVSDEAGVNQNFGYWILQWCNLTDNTIWVWFTYPGGEQPLYDDVRVMIWEISEP